MRCDHCGQDFAASRPEAKYCSGACRVAAHRKRQAATDDGILAAAFRANDSRWQIGDALVKEIPVTLSPKEVLANILACAKELEENGLEATPEHLVALRRVAVAFPPSKRLPIDWRFHLAAVRSPDSLKDILARWPKDEPLTSKRVRQLLVYCRKSNARAARAVLHI